VASSNLCLSALFRWGLSVCTACSIARGRGCHWFCQHDVSASECLDSP
jgi:hypothetical protein